MGRRRKRETKDSTRTSQTLPPSPSHSFSSSSSSSDFEFSVSVSPRNKSSSAAALCPADELFYKGQLLPLHLSPRISMVRSLLLASSSSSSDTTTTTASRYSTGSTSSSGSNDSNFSFNSSDLVLLADQCDSSRPSSVTEDDEFRKLNGQQQIKRGKYFSLTRLFKKDLNNSPVKRMSSTAREVIRKYLKKVKPLYEKFSQSHQKQQQMEGSSVVKNNNTACVVGSVRDHLEASAKNTKKENSGIVSHSFSGNLRYPMRRKSSYVSSCPSSMRSSPSHSGVLSRSGFSGVGVGVGGGGRAGYTDSRSSMEELQSAIQGAIAHCKNSMNKSLVSNEL